MLSGTTLFAGLDGAVGSAFIPALNRLAFVEFDGELDALDLAGPTLTFLGDGYAEPEDIVVAADGHTAYITERVGNLLRVDLGNGARINAEVVASGMNAPHQIVLDEGNSRAYVVEFANPGRLLRIDLTNGTMTTIATGFDFAIGLAITSDLSTAYVSEQASGGGRIREVDLASGIISNFVTGLTNPFFLTWINASQDALLVPERDPANRLSIVNVTGGAPIIVVSPVGFRPSSVTLTAPGQILIACDQEIDTANLLGEIDKSVLLLAIGNVPWNAVLASGRADTTIFPNYFYQVQNVPFGGTLPLLVNHESAFAAGAAWYRVFVDGVVGLDTWTDLKLNPATQQFEQVVMTPQTVALQPGFYPVRNPGDIWLHGDLGDLLSTFRQTDGQHSIQVEFVDGGGKFIALSNVISPLLDNSPCVAVLDEPTLDGQTADSVCGFLPYTALNMDPVTIDFTASQPHEDANYSFALIKGANGVASESGPVAPPPAPFTIPLETLMKKPMGMGSCRVAGCSADLYVAATAINGWDRQSQYDRSAQVAFAVAPAGS